MLNRKKHIKYGEYNTHPSEECVQYRANKYLNFKLCNHKAFTIEHGKFTSLPQLKMENCQYLFAVFVAVECNDSILAI